MPIPTKADLEIHSVPLISIPTPRWILEWISAHDGGWFHPMLLGEQHPLLDEEEWECEHCLQGFVGGQYALITPLNDSADPRWLAYHRPCMMIVMGINQE